MKFWLLLNGKVHGPYGGAELIAMENFGPGTLLCPSQKAPKRLSNWKPAFQFKELSDFAEAWRSKQADMESGEAPAAPRPAARRRVPWIQWLPYAALGAAIIAGRGLLSFAPTSVPAGAGPRTAGDAPLLLLPSGRPGQPAGDAQTARIQRKLAPLRLPAGPATLGDAAGPHATWKSWPLDRARSIVEISGMPAGGRCRLLYNGFSRTVRASDPAAAALLGSEPLPLP